MGEQGEIVGMETLRGRRRRLAESLMARGMNALLSDSPTDIYYFTGCLDVAGYLIVRPNGDTLLLTSAHDGPQARTDTRETEVMTWNPGEDPLDRLLPVIRSRAQRVITPSGQTALRQRLCQAGESLEIVVEAGFTARQRRTKDPGELQLIRRAAGIVETGMAAARSALMPGVREVDVAAEAEQAMRKEGSDGRVFETKVESGPRSAQPSRYASERVIQEGDLVLIDLGPTYRGYYGDLTRTFVFGEPSPHQRDLLELVLDAQRAALQAARVSKAGHEVDAAARTIIANAGYGDQFLHHTGHGLGLAGDAPLLLAPGSSEKLIADECVTVEPGVYVEHIGGARIEDEVLITSEGIELLTTFEKSLESLVICV